MEQKKISNVHAMSMMYDAVIKAAKHLGLPEVPASMSYFIVMEFIVTAVRERIAAESQLVKELDAHGEARADYESTIA